METEKSLFDLSVDMAGKEHLKEAAKWGRFLAIVGFIGLAFLVVFSVIVAVSDPTGEVGGDPVDKTELIAGSLIGSLIVVALYFFPCLSLLRFATKLRTAIDTNDTINLNESFRNLKITLRYFGVITILFMVLLFIGLLSDL
jgi:uncharacterized membrane protein YkvI